MMDPRRSVEHHALNVPSAADAGGIFKVWSVGTQAIKIHQLYLDTLQPSSEDKEVYLGFAGGVDNPSAKAGFGWDLPKLLDDANNETQML